MTYVKGKHAEAALKDLCKYCKKDDIDMLIAHQLLGEWKVVQNDLS